MAKKLTIACDLGASLTKVFYRLETNGQTIDQMRTFASAVQRTNQSRYLAGQYGDDNTSLVEING
jgi:hypothetical protein